jgi:Fe-S-cluster containining protein
MAKHLDMLPDEFLKKYARRRRGWWSLREVQVDGAYDCVFLRRDEKTQRALCGIYEVRPRQCRTWPFWPENLKSLKAWEKAAEGCPGMDNDGAGEGSFFPLERIRRL